MPVNFTVQKCRPSKRLRSIHGTVEVFCCFFFFFSQYFSTTLLKAYLQQFLLSGTSCLAIDKFSSVQSLSCVRLFASGLQHARLPCPSPTPRVYSNSCPLSQWCHPTISCSVVLFSSHLQPFPASDLFKWVSSSNQVAKVLEFQPQHQSFQWTPRIGLL